MSLVSVIIPAYNAALYLEECIQSVLNQTWKSLEIIIVNDGSTDKTADIVRPYLADNRIRYIFQKNQGCSSAKNTGLSAATGDYIQYLDADDMISPDKINAQLQVLQQDPLKLAVCKTYIFDNSTNTTQIPLDIEFLYSTSDSLEFILNLYGLNGTRGMIQPNAFLFSKELSLLTGPWDMTLSPSPDEDGEYFCRMMLQSSGIEYVDAGINYYRKSKSNTSLSSNHDQQHAIGSLKSIKLKADHLLKAENSYRVRYVIALEYSAYMYQYFSEYPELASEAEEKATILLGNKLPLSGGKLFQFIAERIGLHSALQLKSQRDQFRTIFKNSKTNQQ
ncbi:MAG: glycosyltransferase family 2 protein [Saprospiraceae bacterium]|nr:glycosyltransferase family 2 protein [Saprospiraceae bacterium]